MTRADRDTALANLSMTRALVRKGFPAGREHAELMISLGTALSILEAHQPEDAK